MILLCLALVFVFGSMTIFAIWSLLSIYFFLFSDLIQRDIQAAKVRAKWKKEKSRD